MPEGFVAVEITGAEEAGADVADFSILSNSRNVGDFASRSISGDGKKAVIQIPVEGGENKITITGTNEFGYLTERSVEAIAKKVEEKPRGKLYVVVVGAEKYPLLQTECGGPCDLRYPVDDAAELLSVLAEKSAPLYSGMEALVLVNQESLDETPELASAIGAIPGVDAVIEPEADNVADQLADFLDKPTADDTTIVFIAGHGINVDEDYYFIPSDGRKSDPDKWKRSSLVEWSDIQKAIETRRRRALPAARHLPRRQRVQSAAGEGRRRRAHRRVLGDRRQQHRRRAARARAWRLHLFRHRGAEGRRQHRRRRRAAARARRLHLPRRDRDHRDKQKPFYYISSMENILLARP